MPYSILFSLDASGARHLPENAVPALHATFFQWLACADAYLARRLDSGNGAKPFTVSGLSISDNGRADFRITLLDDSLHPLLQSGIRQKPEVRVLSERLPIIGEPSAAHRTYQNLVDQARADMVVMLRFDSPTSFRSNEMHYPLPDPVMVFTSYLTRWNAFAPEEYWVHESWLDWARLAIAISRAQLETQVTKFKGYEQVGCVGAVQYRIAEADRSLPRAIVPFNFLADYANFCGTGNKTTQGMGQTRRIERWEEGDDIRAGAAIDRRKSAVNLV